MRALQPFFFMGHAHFGGGHKGAAFPAGKLDLMGSWGTLTDYLIGSSPSRACHPLTPSVVSLPPSLPQALPSVLCASSPQERRAPPSYSGRVWASLCSSPSRVNVAPLSCPLSPPSVASLKPSTPPVGSVRVVAARAPRAPFLSGLAFGRPPPRPCLQDRSVRS
jgi:hypothetical protein